VIAVATDLTIRVAVPDVWDTVTVRATPDWTIARVKREALAVATGRSVDPDAYVVKFRGARVFDESVTLDAARVPDRGALIVLAAHRRPAR
jgi:hypothetical protein